MQCTVYKSSKKVDLYLFVPTDIQPDTLDPAILAPFGNLQAVMTLDLSADRRLARSDTATIRKHIQAFGFHVQMPPGNENWAHWDNLKAGIRGQDPNPDA